MTGHKGFILWITGPDRAKTCALAGEVGGELLERGCRAEILDVDVIERNLAGGLSPSGEGADELADRIGFVCNLLARNDVIAVAAPCERERCFRERVRAAAQAPYVVAHAEADDPAGDYEPPEKAEAVCRAEEDDIRQCAGRILITLESLDLIPKDAGADYSAEEEHEVMRRLKDLGYL